MSLPHLELQEEAYVTLRNDGYVRTLVGEQVYDYVPEDITGNYVVVGDQNASLTRPAFAENEHTFLLAIHGYSDEHRGKKVVAELASLIHTSLHNHQFFLTNYGRYTFRWISSLIETLTPRDHHGQVNFRIVMVF